MWGCISAQRDALLPGVWRPGADLKPDSHFFNFHPWKELLRCRQTEKEYEKQERVVRFNMLTEGDRYAKWTAPQRLFSAERWAAENSQYALRCPTQTEIKVLVYSGATLFFCQLLFCCMLNNANGLSLIFSSSEWVILKSSLRKKKKKKTGYFHILTAVCSFLSKASPKEIDSCMQFFFLQVFFFFFTWIFFISFDAFSLLEFCFYHAHFLFAAALMTNYREL